VERYYTEKRKKAEALERYISGLEEENRRLQKALETVIEINARMAAVTTDQNAVGFCKRIHEEAEQAQEGGGE